MLRGRNHKIISFLILFIFGFYVANAADSDLIFQAPFKSDLAYQYFKIANGYFKDSSNKLTASVNANCQKDIQFIFGATENYEKWGLQWPDSWGRLPFGVLWGHAKSYGAYRECVAAAHPADSHLRGQYCLANIPIKTFMDKLSDKVSRLTFKKVDPVVMELGICVPTSCTPKETNSILKAILRDQYSIVPDLAYNEITMVLDRLCDDNKPIKLRPIDIVAITFISVIVFFMIASSVYDHIKTKRNEPKKPLFIAFSVITNAPKVFTVKKSNNPNILTCLSGMRSFSMMWVIFGHGYITYYNMPHVNFDTIYPWFGTPYSILLHNATLCVDTFFFLSGLLVLWGAFREMEKTKGKLNIPMMYFHRYVRLTPVVAVVMLYILSLYKYSGSGPMWLKIGTQDERCSKSWWANLLYVQNYAFPHTYCMTQSWYLAVDTQLYVLSPLVLIPLWKWGKKALPFAGIFVILTIGCMFATFIVNDFTTFRVDDDNYDDRQVKTYYPTHTRVPTWLLGMIFGYLLFTENRGKKIPLATHWVLLGWVVAFGTMLGCLWGPYWRQVPGSPNPAPVIEAAFYEALSRPCWTIAMGWIIWACYNGHGGYINDFLSWDFFTVLSRLSYCMYVIHRIVQFVNFGRVQTDTIFDNYDYILHWWGDFGITLCASCFATLAFEVPILGIESAIFDRKKSPTLPTTVPKLEISKDPSLTTVDTEDNNSKNTLEKTTL